MHGGDLLEKLLRRKEGYLLTAFLDHAAEPVQHAGFGLLWAHHGQRIKLLVKRNVSRCSGEIKSGTALRQTFELNVSGTVQRGRAVQCRD